MVAMVMDLMVQESSPGLDVLKQVYRLTRPVLGERPGH